MNDAQFKGRWKQISGEAKKVWGRLTDDDWKASEGSIEKLTGKIQEKYGDAKEAVQERLGKIIASITNKVDDVTDHADKPAARPFNDRSNKVL